MVIDVNELLITTVTRFRTCCFHVINDCNFFLNQGERFPKHKVEKLARRFSICQCFIDEEALLSHASLLLLFSVFPSSHVLD